MGRKGKAIDRIREAQERSQGAQNGECSIKK
jgi:hypothetical protein